MMRSKNGLMSLVSIRGEYSYGFYKVLSINGLAKTNIYKEKLNA